MNPKSLGWYEKLGPLAKEIVDTDREHAALFAAKVLPMDILDRIDVEEARRKRTQLRAHAHRTWGNEAKSPGRK